MVKARFHAPRALADEYIGTALRAASFFTAAEIVSFDYFKIGFVVRRGEGYITFFKYEGRRTEDKDPCQQILMKGPALAYMVEHLAKHGSPKAMEMLHQMREGLGMIQAFAPHQLAKPKGCAPA